MLLLCNCALFPDDEDDEAEEEEAKSWPKKRPDLGPLRREETGTLRTGVILTLAE
jgi:hypothetical protein